MQLAGTPSSRTQREYGSRNLPILHSYSVQAPLFRNDQSARAATTAAMMTPAELAIWFAPPVNGVGEGAPVAEGPLELPFMLLIIKDGQGVPSDIDGLDLVTVTSGAGPEGQAVPQRARTVDYEI